MDAFSLRVRTFDAFPKVDLQHTERSSRGGFSTLLTYFCGLFLVWVEVGAFLGGYVDHQYALDHSVRELVALNVDILVAMPCQFLHTNVQDITDDRFLAAEVLNFEGTNFFVPESFAINNANQGLSESGLDDIMRESMRAEFRLEGARFDEGAPACHIFGSIPVNKVKGDFRITGKGFGYRDRLNVPFEALNFTHVILEFSYGDFYPFLNNPLDFTGKTTDERLQAYKYYAKVVPTVYQRLGVVVDTNQYSLTEQHHAYKLGPHGRPSGIPGIFFNYDFEPIRLVVTEKRLPFLQFVAKLGTIVGGLMVLAGYAYRLYEKLLGLAFGRKYVKRDTEKLQGGLLARETPPQKTY